MKALKLLALAAGLATSGSALAHGTHHAVSESVSTMSDTLPDVPLQDHHGGATTLKDAVGDGRADTLVTFTYTRCETLCPVVVPMAAGIVRELEAEGKPARLVVLTVDSEHDGLAEMAAHAEALGAQPSDIYLTGQPEQVRQALRFFGITSRDPEAHPPLILTRAAGENAMKRIVVGDRTTPLRIRALLLTEE